MMLSICDVSSYWFRSIGDHFSRNLEIRGDHLCLAIEEVIVRTGYVFIGAALGLFSFVTLGLRSDAIAASGRYLSETKRIISVPYTHVLLALNPGASVPPLSSGDLWGDGVLRSVRETADRLSGETGFFKKHIGARMQYGFYGICSLTLRLAQGAIGIVAALFSLCTLGLFRPLNRVAYYGLEFPLVLRDLLFVSVKCLNPH